MKYLFIGGPKDGERLEVPVDTLYWKFAEMVGVTWDDYINPFSDKNVSISEHIYRKQAFNGENGKLFAYVYVEIPDVMETLLKGYRKGKRKTKKKIKIY